MQKCNNNFLFNLSFNLGGKSEFIANLVKYRSLLFTSQFSRIIYAQPESLAHRPNSCFEKIKKTFLTAELVNGLPNISKLNLDLNNLPTLLIIDDQMTTLLDSPSMVDLLTVKGIKIIMCIL